MAATTGSDLRTLCSLSNSFPGAGVYGSTGSFGPIFLKSVEFVDTFFSRFVVLLGCCGLVGKSSITVGCLKFLLF